MSFILQSIHAILRQARILSLCVLLLIFALGGCKKYLDVPLPVDSIASESVFSNDQTSAGALNSVYASMVNAGYFDGTGGTTYSLGLYGDELVYYGAAASLAALYKDAVGSSLGGVTAYWSYLYGQLYSINQAIQGIQANNTLTYQHQWLGEAYFMRGLIYFYLTNMYGDVPLVLTPDYLKNNGLARNPQTDVYKQIVTDLKQAQSLLDDQYHDDGGAVTADRGRPNRMAATALLAKTYLYTKEWADAEIQADSVIANSVVYQLPAPDMTFQLNSPETIWGLEPIGSLPYPYEVTDARFFTLPNGTVPGPGIYTTTMSDSLKNAFETGDLRYTSWVGKDTVPANGTNPPAIYYYPYKYKVKGTLTLPQESLVLFRLAEQYLIRAEARAMQNELPGAISDLNAIRSRAGLSPTMASTQSDLLNAILQERRVELFCEQGNRFFDLRRTGTLDALMTKIVPLKGGVTWTSYQAWWPIPVTDIQNDPALTQTPGYN